MFLGWIPTLLERSSLCLFDLGIAREEQISHSDLMIRNLFRIDLYVLTHQFEMRYRGLGVEMSLVEEMDTSGKKLKWELSGALLADRDFALMMKRRPVGHTGVSLASAEDLVHKAVERCEWYLL